jgi:predicted component of type VI protein secretion system
VKIYPLKSDPNINYVALVGIYREPPADGWRYVSDVRKMNSRCAKKDSLHTVVGAELHGRKIYKPGTKPETPKAK